MVKRIAFIAIICLYCGLVPAANDNIDSNLNWRIRQEETDRSQIMSVIHQLTDVHGPRLTGSPNFKAACEWALNQMKSWGLQNEHMEAWDFGHPGWANDRYSVRVISPYKDLLDARVVAWTPSTKGVVKAAIVLITPPEHPTAEILDAYLNSVKDKVRDRIVLTGPHVEIPITFSPAAKRREESDLRTQYDPNNPPPERPAQPADDSKILAPRAIDERIDAFLAANGALVRIQDSAREHGQIRVFANRTYNAAKAAPGLVIRNEDYGRMSRVLADGNAVQMEIEILNTVFPDQNSYNAVAEIPGSDKKDQVVMIGGHIDSWHGGLGATDNASGVAVMMEAARVLQSLGVKPRRTIRVALWGGEEQGLLGSKAYVRDHFGTYESQKQEYSALTGYINLDSGTGRVRGASVFGPSEATAVLRQILRPFADMGVMGATSLQRRNSGGTDSFSFSGAGLPGINLSQDPIEYQTHTWHTNLDTYERILEGDLKQCVMVVASLAYHMAMRDDMLPRFSGDSMPPPAK
jgi:carboxypeptidase Q